MSKADKKDPVVTTGKVKDLAVSSDVKKAFGGKPDDTVVSVELPKSGKGVWNPPKKGSKASAASEEIFRQAGDLDNPIVTPGSALDIMLNEHARSLPSVDQIEDAERVLKAAGRVSEGRRGYVNFDGEELVPLQTDLRIDRGRIEVTIDGKTTPIYLGDTREYDTSKRVFNLFVVSGDGSKTVYLVDQDSYVDHPSDRTRNFSWGSGGFINPKQGVLVLIGSSSKRDSILGENVLINADSSDNLLNSSTLIATREQPRPHEVRFLRHDDHRQSDEPWDYNKLTDLPMVKNRAVFADSKFKRAIILDSFLSPGLYVGAHVRNSVIEGASRCHVRNSSIIKSTLFGTSAHLKNTNLTDCGIRAEGELHIKYTVFNHLHLSGKKVMIVNKFNYLSLDTARGKMYLVRSSRHDFDLGSSVYDFQTLKLTVSEEEVRRVICSIMSIDEEGIPQAMTSITNSFANYLTEAVMSRLKVIRLLDEAKGLVNDAGMRSNSYDDVYVV